MPASARIEDGRVYRLTGSRFRPRERRSASTRATCSSRSPRRASGTSARIALAASGPFVKSRRSAPALLAESAPNTAYRLPKTESESVIATPSKPERAQQPVRSGVEGRPACAEARVERVADHHAPGARFRPPGGRRRARPDAGGRGREGDSSVETGAVPRPGKCLAHAAVPPAARPRANASPSARAVEMARAERPAAEIENGCEVDVHAGLAEGAPRRATGARTRPPCPSRMRRAPPAAATRTSTTSRPPGRRRRARGSAWAPGGCTPARARPPTPSGAGSPETTTSAAFCCGVRAEQRRRGAPAAPEREPPPGRALRIPPGT